MYTPKVLFSDHHCRTQSELTEMLKNSLTLLNFMHGGEWRCIFFSFDFSSRHVFWLLQIVELQGSKRTPHTLTDKLCGTKKLGPFDTPYSYLEILFQSDNFVEKSGFKFFFTRTDGPTNVDNELVNAAIALHNTG